MYTFLLHCTVQYAHGAYTYCRVEVLLPISSTSVFGIGF